MQVKATAKGVRMSPRKVGLVASLVRGRSVADALVILEHTPKAAARPISKVIESARANATQNHNLLEQGLVIDEITVGHGPVFKRFRPQAFGRAAPYAKRTSHIRVVISGQDKPAAVSKSAKSKPATSKKSAKSAKAATKTKESA